MTDRIASAPGKIVIAGEYAVLFGAPALSMAVDYRATCRVSGRDQADSELTTVGFRNGSRTFSINDGIPVWHDQGGSKADVGLFEAVLAEAGWPKDGSLAFRLDSTAFSDRATGKKYGFGSSAAVAVALTGACLGEEADLQTIRDVAGRAHRRFQAGTGSGIDIATSAHGGVIRFERGAEVLSVGWPDGLVFRIFWSRAPVSTSDRIRGIDGAASGDEAVALADASIRACDAWQDGSAGLFLSALAGFVERLKHFEEDEGRGIFDAGHGALVRAAREFPGLVYKPCGAGGGDVGMAFSESEDLLADFEKVAVGRGFSCLDAAPDPDGVRFEV